MFLVCFNVDFSAVQFINQTLVLGCMRLRFNVNRVRQKIMYDVCCVSGVYSRRDCYLAAALSVFSCIIHWIVDYNKMHSAPNTVISSLLKSTCSARGRHNMPPLRPAIEACSSLEPGRMSRARSANTRYPAGRLHTAPADRMYATDRRQTASSLSAPGWGITIVMRNAEWNETLTDQTNRVEVHSISCSFWIVHQLLVLLTAV